MINLIVTLNRCVVFRLMPISRNSQSDQPIQTKSTKVVVAAAPATKKSNSRNKSNNDIKKSATLLTTYTHTHKSSKSYRKSGSVRMGNEVANIAKVAMNGEAR